MAENSLFVSKRTELLDLYAKNGVPFLATTRGMHSVRSLKFDAVNLGAGGAIGFLVARKGQTMNFFNYGINDSIELASDPAHRATESDTSQTKGFATAASADMAIEWITMAPRAIKAQYPAATITEWVAANTDPTVLAAITGSVAMVDPFGHAIPVDVGSSATLEHVLYQAVAPHITCRFEWDNADRTEKVGTCDQFVQGGGASFLHANGEPSVNNRFRVPEWFLWAREGQPASQLQVVCKLEDDIVIPFAPVAGPLAGNYPALTACYVEIAMRLGGMLLRVPGSN
jgi:hypothetical protein